MTNTDETTSMTGELNLKKLHHKRGSQKGQLTLFEKFVTHLEAKENLLNRDEIQNLEIRLNKIHPLYEIFDEIQNEIEFIETGNEINNFMEREQFQNNFFKLTSCASRILLQFKEKNAISNTSCNNDNTKKPSVKLPLIKLPIFDGTFILWQEYFDSFNTLIHTNLDLTDVQKLVYLKSTLKGEPAELLRPFQTTEQNYTIAWTLLQKRYNNKRRIINNHVQAILDISHMTREAHESLRQIINTVQIHTQCLKSLNQPVESWDAIMVPIITAKLDFHTNKDWEAKLSNENDDNEGVPSLDLLLQFLSNRQITLEMITKTKPNDKFKTNSNSNSTNRVTKTFSAINSLCPFCNESHFIVFCESFLKLDVITRSNKARELELCGNCLRKGHFAKYCRSQNVCKKCNKKHHTLLHVNSWNQQSSNNNCNVAVAACLEDVVQAPNTNESQPLENVIACTSHMVDSQVMLSTARVHVADKDRQWQEVRVLLDSASQSNFITSNMCAKLGLIKEPIDINVTGINQSISSISHKTEIKIKSRTNNFEVKLSCLVIPQIADQLPSRSCKFELFRIPPNIKLADPTFNVSTPIDMLIGADTFYDLLCVGQIKQPSLPMLQKTKLGWVVSGKMSALQTSQNKQTSAFLTLNELHKNVEKFWQIDEFNKSTSQFTEEENYCQSFFKQTTTRDTIDGRFIVQIPFKTNLNEIGDSRSTAESRFKALERRFQRNHNLKIQYSQFIQEYIELGHMTKINFDNKGFFLPHHPVMKEASETTKLRVVFDGSCKLDTGLAVNDTQYVGPTIQDDLFSIIGRFRTYEFVLTGDVAKMYRQVWIHPNDRQYQRIIWRNESNEPLQCYELNTVTYGTTAAPFLAIRCLHEIAIQNEQLSVESEIIKRDFYVDDLLTGSNSIKDLKIIKTNLYKILKPYGFILRKWNSNVKELCESTSLSIPITEKIQKTLGINWDPNSDTFTYSSQLLTNHEQTTKRTILATTAQLFDPLGLLAPIIIIAKLIIQELWQLKLGWDESVPLDIQTKWFKFRSEFKFINRIQIPRHVIISQAVYVELHAFSDASERGYGTCIYLRSINQNNQINIKLLAAKSRVAPLKNLTLPRLELCAAVLSAQLTNKFKQILNLKLNKEYYWCDSQIVLCWLKAPSNKWKTYVANRIAEIQSLTEANNWYYVKSGDNSADLISRGVLPSQLVSSRLWWHGPHWLEREKDEWPTYHIQPETIETSELKKQTILNSFPVIESKLLFPIHNYSSIQKLKRIVALCIRFKNNCLSSNDNRKYGTLTIHELQDSLTRLIKVAQWSAFPKELNDLKKGKAIHAKSNILSLTPFIDQRELIRVGGRLHLSSYKYDKKHPILLPKNHHLTKLIILSEHKKLLHGGVKLTLSTVREQFWPIGGKELTKQIIKNCVKCFRFNPTLVTPIMGTLPTERTLIMPPFHSTGVDYAGPFIIKDRQGRGNKVSKCYISLFVCFSTKAVHLELVTDLSTDCFLSALRRFIARRGKPLNMFSDNGTNFIGANNELIKLGEFLTNNVTALINAIGSEGIIWHFIPPRSPHFGGLWEAGVKSVKHHLKRVVSSTPLTYEDFSTVIIQIESILNSRPLTSLTTDPNDLDVLTPAHFLIGRPFTTIPDPDVRDVQLCRLNRYQHLQLIIRHFWSKWSKEYLCELQQRSKWKQNTIQLKIGMLVLIKEDDFPPARWKIGRVIEIHPGKDNIIRVATVKCSGGAIIKRAVSKLCILPIGQV